MDAVDGLRSDELVIKPLTLELWPTFEELLDQGGPASRCWCMAPRVGSAYRRRVAAENRADFYEVVAQGPPPGLLALHSGIALGWVQVTPRASVPALETPWRLRPVDDVPVWSLSCFYVRKGNRRQGIMSALVSAAVDFARTQDAPAIEAYPLDGAVSPSATSTGYASVFAAEGFDEVARRSPERPIMRLMFNQRTRLP